MAPERGPRLEEGQTIRPPGRALAVSLLSALGLALVVNTLSAGVELFHGRADSQTQLDVQVMTVPLARCSSTFRLVDDADSGYKNDNNQAHATNHLKKGNNKHY